ncbi:hypothetical protein NMY22_g11483 [Coprinellus aureogranulatus]|nr:hypothetical protein NMY22_g11483 [Coprinellus aureogranulatus]
MYFKPTFLVLLFGLSASVNAVVVDLFSDGDCKKPAGSRNVYDNTCALLGGFSSFKITAGGGINQKLSAYSRNACAEQTTACVNAVVTGDCVKSFNSRGASNAMSSSFVCGAV